MVLTLLTLVAAVLNTALATLVWSRFARAASGLRPPAATARMHAAWFFIGTIGLRVVFAFAHHVVLPAATSPGQVLAVAVLRWALLPIASLLQLLFFLNVYETRWITARRSLVIAAAYAALAVVLVMNVLSRAPVMVSGAAAGAIDPYAMGPRSALLLLFNASWIPGTFVVIRVMVRDRSERLPLALVLASTILGTALGIVASRVGSLGTAAVLFDVVVTGSFAYLLLHRRVFETTKIAIEHALRSMAEGVAVIASDGGVLFTNPAMEGLLPLRAGRPARAEEARDSAVEELLGSLGRARTEAVIEIARAPQRRSGPRAGADPERQWRSLSIATNPITDRDGRLHGHLVIAQDVTISRKNERELTRRNEELWRANRVQAQLLKDVEERKIAEQEAHRAEEEALRAKAAADAANATKSAFLARMSHELRTPLNAILGYAQLILRDPEVPARHRKSLEIVGKSGEHLLSLINHVLDLSKIEAGKIAVTEAAFDLHKLLGELREMFHDRARNKGIALIVEIDPGLPPRVRTDEGKLRQALINLLGNALKFTEEGRVSLSASVESSDDDRVRLLFVVEDTGPGIDEEARQSLFQAFSVTGRTAEEGSGLGLSISLELARLLGGDLRIASDPGAGARFELTIEASIAALEDVENASGSRPVIALAPGQPALRLLVADDRWENRDLLLRVLSIPGIEVRGAANGEEAIAEWEAWEPHAIWMDMRMPKMDGYEATRRIKATPRGQATVILALTASAFEQDREAVLAAGCDDFVRKPFREAEIFEKLERHLGARFVRAELTEAASRSSAPPPLAFRAALRGLPQDVRADLVRAAKSLNPRIAREAIQRLRTHDKGLADALDALAGAYRFDRIQDLLHEGKIE